MPVKGRAETISLESSSVSVVVVVVVVVLVAPVVKVMVGLVR
jgi:hypothetical protein